MLENVPIFKKDKKENPGNYRPASAWLSYGEVYSGSYEKHFRDNALVLASMDSRGESPA